MSHRVPLALAALACLVAPPLGAQDQAACWSELEDIREVSQHFGAARIDSRILILRAEQNCRQGQGSEAKQKIAKAWRLMLEDADLMASPAADVPKPVCSEGLQAASEKIAAVPSDELWRDGAERLLEQARTLCADDRLADAQDRLGLVWGMLERD